MYANLSSFSMAECFEVWSITYPDWHSENAHIYRTLAFYECQASDKADRAWQSLFEDSPPWLMRKIQRPWPKCPFAKPENSLPAMLPRFWWTIWLLVFGMQSATWLLCCKFQVCLPRYKRSHTLLLADILQLVKNHQELKQVDYLQICGSLIQNNGTLEFPNFVVRDRSRREFKTGWNKNIVTEPAWIAEDAWRCFRKRSRSFQVREWHAPELWSCWLQGPDQTRSMDCGVQSCHSGRVWAAILWRAGSIHWHAGSQITLTNLIYKYIYNMFYINIETSRSQLKVFQSLPSSCLVLAIWWES